MKHFSRTLWIREVGATSLFLIIFGLIRVFLLSQQESPHVGRNTVAVFMMALYVCIATMVYLVEGKLKDWSSFSLNGFLLCFAGYLAWNLTTTEKKLFYFIFITFISVLIAAIVNMIYFFKYKEGISHIEKDEIKDYLSHCIPAKIMTFVIGFTLIEYVLMPIVS